MNDQSSLLIKLPSRPAWSGLRTLIIPRSDDGFGFTLRQLIVTPPTEQQYISDGRLSHEPMESFHVSDVKAGSNAELAGLQAGDRIISVDRLSTTNRTFAQVVQQMQSRYGNLHLVVVPKDEDILQLTYQSLLGGNKDHGKTADACRHTQAMVAGVRECVDSSGTGSHNAGMSVGVSTAGLLSTVDARSSRTLDASVGQAVSVSSSSLASNNQTGRQSSSAVFEIDGSHGGRSTDRTNDRGAGNLPQPSGGVLQQVPLASSSQRTPLMPPTAELFTNSDAGNRHDHGRGQFPPNHQTQQQPAWHADRGQSRAPPQSVQRSQPNWQHGQQHQKSQRQYAHQHHQHAAIVQHFQQQQAMQHQAMQHQALRQHYLQQQQRPQHRQQGNGFVPQMRVVSDAGYHQRQDSPPISLGVVSVAPTAGMYAASPAASNSVTGSLPSRAADSREEYLPHRLSVSHSGDRLVPQEAVTGDAYLTSAAYQLSAPRLPQQIVRAPAEVVSLVEQRHADARSGGSGEPEQSASLRYLPAYDGGGGSVRQQPAVGVAHRSPAGRSAGSGQRPLTTAFESGTSQRQQYAQSNRVAAGSSEQERLRLSQTDGRAATGTVPPRTLAIRTGSEQRLAPDGQQHWESPGYSQARSPIQKETTFDGSGGVVQHYYTVEQPGPDEARGSSHRHRFGSDSDTAWRAPAELHWRVASDNNLVAAGSYSAVGGSGVVAGASYRLVPNADILQQRAIPAAGEQPAGYLKSATSLSSPQQNARALENGFPSTSSLVLKQDDVPPLATGAAVPPPAVCRRERLPSEAAGMICDQGFVPSVAAENAGMAVGGSTQNVTMPRKSSYSTAVQPPSQQARHVYGSAERSLLTLALRRASAGDVARESEDLKEEDDKEDTALIEAGNDDDMDDSTSGSVADARSPSQRKFRGKLMHRSKSTDGGRLSLIRRTSYMMATTAAPTKTDYLIHDDKVPSNEQLSGQAQRYAEFLRTQRSVDGVSEQRGAKIKEFADLDKERAAPLARDSHYELQKSSSASAVVLPPSPLPITKEGVLMVKAEKIDGKKSSDRSWKLLGVVLCGRLLYLTRERKENTVPTQAGDDIPINIKQCTVDVAYGYTKKKNVFKLDTVSSSEYLFQAGDQEEMIAWISAIIAGSDPSKADAASNADMILRRFEQRMAQSPVGGSKSGGTSSSGVKRLAVLWNRQHSPVGSADSGTGSKKDRRAIRLQRGASSPASLSAADEQDGDSAARVFGIPLNECSPAHENECVPRVVEHCTKAIEERGLEFTGLYRVPGNSAAVATLQDELNRGVVDLENDRWRDVNVVGSLLKLFFRKLPEPLVTAALYRSFIEANREEKYTDRLTKLKQLVHQLPECNFETLKYLAKHLKKVASVGHLNKMDERNLAIVFGPTLVHSSDDNMLSMVTDMSDQCGIVETVITQSEWMFSSIGEPVPQTPADKVQSAAAPISETMQLIGDDIARMISRGSETGSGGIKKELITTVASATSRKLKMDVVREKSKWPTTSAPIVAELSSSSDSGDHGFAERNIDEEVAVRKIKMQEHEASKMAASGKDAAGSRAFVASSSNAQRFFERQDPFADLPPLRGQGVSSAVSLANEDPGFHGAAGSWLPSQPLNRWHSEESILEQPDALRRSSQARSALNQVLHFQDCHQGSFGGSSSAIGLSSVTNCSPPSPPPPPLPARRYRSSSEENCGIADRSVYEPEDYTGISFAVKSNGLYVDPSNTRPPLPPRLGMVNAPLTLLQNVEADPRGHIGMGPQWPDQSTPEPNACSPGSISSSSSLPTYQNIYTKVISPEVGGSTDAIAYSRQSKEAPQASNTGLGQRKLSATAVRHEPKRTPSADSTLSSSDCSSDLLSAITSTFDQKLQYLRSQDNPPREPADNADTASICSNGSDRSFDRMSQSLHATVAPLSRGSPRSRPAAATLRGAGDGLDCNPLTNVDRSFRDPSLNKGQQQPAAKIGIASRIERTDMKPRPFFNPMGSLVPSASTSVLYVGTGNSLWFPGYAANMTTGEIHLRSNSSDSIADDRLSKINLTQRPPGILGAREGIVKSFVNKFEQKNSQPISAAPRMPSVVVNSANSVGASRTPETRDRDIPKRKATGDKNRSRRRHTIGGSDNSEIFAEAAHCGSSMEIASQQPSAWERLRPALKRDASAPRSLLDWIASERARGSSPDIFSMQAADGDTAYRRLATRRLAADTSGPT